MTVQDLQLTSEQRQILKHHGEDFKNWINTEKGSEEIQQHTEHSNYFREKLSPENLARMTENEFSEIWKKTWASRSWGNKDWYLKNKLIDPNGTEKIRNELHVLLYGSEDFGKRYDQFRQNLEGFGVAIISEFLNMIFPDKYCLWNDTPRTVLSFIGLTSFSEKAFKSRILNQETIFMIRILCPCQMLISIL